MASTGRHRRRRPGQRSIGLCATAVLGGMVTVAAAPASGTDASFLATHAAASFGLASATEDALGDRETDFDRASRDVARIPAAALRALPAPPPAPAPPAAAPAPAPAPVAAPAPAKPKAAAAPKAAATPAPKGFSTSTARTGADVERGLTANAMKVLNAVRAAYPQLGSIGGRRSDSGDHGTGRALDVMIPNYSGSGRALGDALAAFIQSHAGELGVSYVIWRQRIWTPGRGGWRSMSDRGSATANHYDHVHISVH